jgi:hypothetical protein
MATALRGCEGKILSQGHSQCHVTALARAVVTLRTLAVLVVQRVPHPQEQLSATDVTAKRPAKNTKGSTLDMLNFLSSCSALSASFGTCVCNNVCPLYATSASPTRTALRHGRDRQTPR